MDKTSRYEYLSLAHDLAVHGFFQGQPPPGTFVARRFADYGFEEFLVLPYTLLVSTLSGEKTEFPRDDRASVFMVPSVEHILAEFESIKCTVAVARTETRRWSVQVLAPQSEKEAFVESRWLEVGMLTAFAEVVGHLPPSLSRGRTLMTSR